MASTLKFVDTFIRDHLTRNGFYTYSTHNSTPTCAAQDVLRNVAEKFHPAFCSDFQAEMKHYIHLTRLNEDENSLQVAFCAVLDAACKSGIGWGRIVGIYVLSAASALRAMDPDCSTTVDNIILWTADYLEDKRFSTWIAQHGGYVSKVNVSNSNTL